MHSTHSLRQWILRRTAREWRDSAVHAGISSLCSQSLPSRTMPDQPFLRPLQDTNQTQQKLDNLRWFSKRRSRTQVLCAQCVRCDVSSDRIALLTFCVMPYASRLIKMPHFGGCAPWRGLWFPDSSSDDILCNAPTCKVHHPMFAHSEVTVLTNKPTNPDTNKQTLPKTLCILRYDTMLGKDTCKQLQYCTHTGHTLSVTWQ